MGSNRPKATTLDTGRRQLTVMFFGLVGSSASSRLDPEDMRDVIGVRQHGLPPAATNT
jgi:class 3 adenylate cyclase